MSKTKQKVCDFDLNNFRFYQYFIPQFFLDVINKSAIIKRICLLVCLFVDKRYVMIMFYKNDNVINLQIFL